MKYSNSNLIFIILILLPGLFNSCTQKLKTNEFIILINEDNSGWHFVDIQHDTINKGYHKITVKFEMGQRFQTAILRSGLENYRPVFLNSNKDTIQSKLWFLGQYNFDSLQRIFLCLYVPTDVQRRTIKDNFKYTGYDSLRYEMDTVVENYLRKRKELN